ncbi:Periplasmic binding protein [compost metagenome]|jgi:branched-chain amino acid transport system substrate-binding protein
MATFSRMASALAVLALAGGIAHADETTGLTQDTIKIGIFGPMTGAAALFGKAVFGVESVYKSVNDAGGIHGRKIVLVREDTACDPTRGLAAFKKLASQDQVFALDAGLCSNVVMAAKADIEKSGIPFMGLGAATPGIATPLAANMFQPVATTDEVGRSMIDFAMSKPGTAKIAIISHSDDWGKSNRDPAVAYLKSKYGLAPALDLTMERGSTDATPQILKLRGAGADFVLVLMYPAEVAIFMRDAYKYGVKVPVLAPQSISLEDTRNRVGSLAPVANMAVYYPYSHPTDTPEMRKWSDLIHKYYPNERIEAFSFLGMSGALAMVQALKDAGPDLTRSKLIAALDNIRNFESGISATPISFSPTDHAGVKGGAFLLYGKDGKPMVVKRWPDAQK